MTRSFCFHHFPSVILKFDHNEVSASPAEASRRQQSMFLSWKQTNWCQSWWSGRSLCRLHKSCICVYYAARTARTCAWHLVLGDHDPRVAVTVWAFMLVAFIFFTTNFCQTHFKWAGLAGLRLRFRAKTCGLCIVIQKYQNSECPIIHLWYIHYTALMEQSLKTVRSFNAACH